MDIKIREATINDLDNNLLNLYIIGFKLHQENRGDIFKKLTEEELKKSLIEKLKNDNEKFLIVEKNKKIIGYLLYKIKEKNIKTIWIDEFVIDKDFRGHGFGKMLMNELRKICKENACKKIELNCWAFNDGAIGFYKKIGFNEQRIVFEEII